MRRIVPVSIAGAAGAIALAALLSPVLGDSLRRGISSTSRVTLDGRTFGLEESGTDIESLKRAFERYGLDVPEDFGRMESGDLSRRIFSGRLAPVPASTPSGVSRTPRGLTAEHTLRLESGSSGVDLVFGRMEHRGRSIRDRLARDGWDAGAPGQDPSSVKVLRKSTGKEEEIVFLDEEEGSFLLLLESNR